MTTRMKHIGCGMAVLGLALGLDGKPRAAEPVVELPGWVKKLDLKGDLRLRYQWEEREESASAGDEAGIPKHSRQRGRFRLRLGFTETISPSLVAGFGLASGGNSTNGGDPRSTNQTLENTFEKPDLRIDYAFLAYKKALNTSKELILEGGKFPLKDAIWGPGDVLFDTDITLDGGTARLTHKSGEIWDLGLALGILILDEESNTTRNSDLWKDPMLYTLQLPFTYNMGETFKVRAAATYYNFDDLYNQRGLNNSAGGNSTITVIHPGPVTLTALKYDFDSLGLALGLEQLPAGPFYVSLFGEYLKNPDLAKDIERELAEDPDKSENALYRKRDTAYIAGLRFGHAGVKQGGQWQVAYNYRGLQSDSWPDALPDSDAYGGRTGISGHELMMTYGLGKGVTLAVDYYRLQKITLSTEKERDHLVQIDLQAGF